MVFRMSSIAQLNERIDQLETQLLLKDIETIKQAEKKLNSDLGKSKSNAIKKHLKFFKKNERIWFPFLAESLNSKTY